MSQDSIVHHPCIAILSDFGSSEYLGMMKAVLISKGLLGRFFDLWNSVPQGSIREGVWVLQHAMKFCPRGTIFLAVVDPTVGTSRKALAIQTNNFYFVGPDNGLLSPAIEDDIKEIVVINRSPRSNTFHGRDIFAPTAAEIALGSPLNKLGIPQENIKTFNFFYCESSRTGEVVRVDEFGNVITNLLPIIGQKTYCYNDDFDLIFRTNYAEGREDELFVIVSSYGTLEITKRNASANAELHHSSGDRLKLK